MKRHLNYKYYNSIVGLAVIDESHLHYKDTSFSYISAVKKEDYLHIVTFDASLKK